ncbi:uncharacterized protein LOC117168084 [Belonocnema kinseyi]|uniref:uncharacterized protein LOC117168084 n=1 Tax=Belonocnema kinseyi TaxID=2817044 RepID=UPI00143DC02F|nr:uncharacterized protein LOC117168084 [Belonocnema kinseyi]
MGRYKSRSCNLGYNSCEEDRTLLSVPSDSNRLLEWETAIPRQNYTSKNGQVVYLSSFHDWLRHSSTSFLIRTQLQCREKVLKTGTANWTIINEEQLALCSFDHLAGLQKIMCPACHTFSPSTKFLHEVVDNVNLRISAMLSDIFDILSTEND